MNKPGGQGSSDSSSGSSSDSGSGGSDLYDSGEGEVDNSDSGDYAFGFPGMEGGDWNEKDDAQVDMIIADITKLQNRGKLKTEKDIKSYLNEVMKDNGITLAQYQAIKLIYGFE